MLNISAKTTCNEILAYAIPEVPRLADAAPMTHIEALELVKENLMPTYVLQGRYRATLFCPGNLP